MPKCQICGLEIPDWNNAGIIFAIAMGHKPEDRKWDHHLLPVRIGSDDVVCAGRPNLAQYIEGQPKAPGGFYSNVMEAKIRSAQESLLANNKDGTVNKKQPKRKTKENSKK